MDTRNTGDSAASSPGKTGIVVASFDIHGVSLSRVFGHKGVHVVNNIGTDGSSEDRRKGHVAYDRVVSVIHRNRGTR
jgi:hypothetical protein